MKIGKLAVNFLKVKLTIEKKNTLRKETYRTYDSLLDIPTCNDNIPEHHIDVYFAPEERRRNACMIYIHGGAYVFSNRKQYKKYAEEFLEYGFDFISVDYRLNDGKRNIKDILFDVFSALNHIQNHKKDLRIENDKLILLGDSAGGHLCLFSALVNHHPEISKEIDLPELNIDLALLLTNSPVYHFETLDKVFNLSKSGVKRLFGPDYFLPGYPEKYSPYTYIDNLNIPIFISTCKKDFLRKEPIALIQDLRKKNYQDMEVVDINSDNKKVGHVHNVVNLKLKESQTVNEAMRQFAEKYLR